MQIYVFAQPLHHEQDVTQCQFLSELKVILIQRFPSKLVV